MREINYIRLEEVPSTNTYVKARAAELPPFTVVHTPRQTAGRGWATNKWESEPGRNLSFTLLFKPRHTAARDQWLISEAVALAIIKGVAKATGIDDLAIKWPNDIYADDRKLAGILIENTLDGDRIAHSVIGVGLNVNQRRFLSDAPNPVSLCQLLAERRGKRSDEVRLPLDTLLKTVVGEMADLLGVVDDTMAETAAMSDVLRIVSREAYMRRLYRNDGEPHDWEDASGHRFAGIVRAVDDNGHLVLEDTATRERRTFAFKEVAQILN